MMVLAHSHFEQDFGAQSGVSERVIDLKRRLDECKREKEELLGVVAHELNTALCTLQAQAGRLRKRTTSEVRDGTADAIGDIQMSVRRLKEFVNRLFEAQALERGAIDLQPKRLDVLALMRCLAEVFTDRAEREGCSIIVESNENNMFAIVAPNVITHVLEHLLSNALRLAQPGSQIKIHMRSVTSAAINSDPHNIRISVYDTSVAPSMPSVVPIRRSAKHPCDEFDAGGDFGQTIIKKLVELLNGRLWFESKPQQEAAYVVEFPSSNALANS